MATFPLQAIMAVGSAAAPREALPACWLSATLRAESRLSRPHHTCPLHPGAVPSVPGPRSHRAQNLWQWKESVGSRGSTPRCHQRSHITHAMADKPQPDIAPAVLPGPQLTPRAQARAATDRTTGRSAHWDGASALAGGWLWVSVMCQHPYFYF